jgi:PTS system nitrogen regulatory IIA component
MNDFSQIISPDCIIPNLVAKNREEVLLELTSVLAKKHKEVNLGEVTQTLLNREKDGTTGIGRGVAIPHVRVSEISNNLIVVGRSVKGIDFSALDGKPVHLFFLLLAPKEGIYLKVLAHISRKCQSEGFLDRMMSGSSAQGLFEILVH